jgi:peptidyl-dipeptidase Dcp
MTPAELLPPADGACMSVSFAHLFSGGYAAGYYGYKWAEVLDADAFSMFREKGIFDSRNSHFIPPHYTRKRWQQGTG